MTRYLHVRKKELPMPLVVEGEGGKVVVQSLEPAGYKKLGARLGRADDATVEAVKRSVGRA